MADGSVSSEQAQLFAEQGWLVIPDFVSAEERAALLAQAEALVQGEKNRIDIIYYVYVVKIIGTTMLTSRPPGADFSARSIFRYIIKVKV